METRDDEHLRLLSIFHYILGALWGLAGFFPIIHLVVGVTLLGGNRGGGPGGSGFPGSGFAMLFIGFAAGMILLSWTLAVLMLLAGRNLAARRGRGFCKAVAMVECLLFPLGTILGVFTLVILSRDSVKRLFGAAS